MGIPWNMILVCRFRLNSYETYILAAPCVVLTCIYTAGAPAMIMELLRISIGKFEKTTYGETMCTNRRRGRHCEAVKNAHPY